MFIVLFAYIILCFRLSMLIKYYLVNMRFSYQFGYACDTFDQMFTDDVDGYNYWAGVDKNHIL